jgi:hypothetical protein
VCTTPLQAPMLKVSTMASDPTPGTQGHIAD